MELENAHSLWMPLMSTSSIFKGESMDYVDIAFANNYTPPVLLEDGEQKLVVLKAVYGLSKAENKMITITIKGALERNSAPFNYYLLFPDGEDEDVDNLWQGRMQAYCGATGCEITKKLELGAEDKHGNREIPVWKGAEGYALVGTREASDEFPESNEIIRWNPPAA